MADLVVGLSKTVVEGALTKVQSALEEDAKLRQKAQRDLVAITLEFEMMQSFLDVAKEESVTNNMVRTWVRHVRELAYDLEDCVEFVVHLDNTPEWWRRLLPSCVAPPLPLDRAVQELEELKRRVEDVNNCYRRYSNINESGTSTKLVMLQERGSVDATAFIKARDAAKIHREDLSQLLVNRSIPVISVWGTGGDAGVTSIIWKAYNDQEIRQVFTCRAWVKLMHPFDPDEFVRCLMVQFYANASNEQEELIGVDVVKRTSKATQSNYLDEFVWRVNNERCLVILEGLSSMTDWDAISKFFPSRKKGSCIIVSTQQQSEIATLSVGPSYQVLELKQFSVDHSIYAFYNLSSQCHEDDDSDEDGANLTGETSYQYYGRKVKRKMERVVREVEELELATPEDFKEKEYKSASNWLMGYGLVGRESEINELGQRATMNCWGTTVIPVWGVTGVGKSALVNTLLSHLIINDHSSTQSEPCFEMYAWVDVQHPFSLREFSQSLLLSFYSTDHRAQENHAIATGGSKKPIAECRWILSHKRCLVIIDDLESTEEWDMIRAKLVCGTTQKSIIAITTEETVAKHCQNDILEPVLNVKRLQPDAAFYLFRQMAWFDHIPPVLSTSETAVLQELTSKCGGLPIMIIEVAMSLSKVPGGQVEGARSINGKFIHYLQNNREFDILQGVFSWMRNNFRNCPDSVRPCIFYLPIFPQGYVFRRRRLVRRWIAEGYSKDSHEESAEDNGEKNFSKLLDVCILQHPTEKIFVGDVRMVMCQVDGFMRDYIMSRQMEENLVFELGGSCVLTTQRTGRHLTILEHWDRDKTVFNNIDFSRLRSLTVFGKWESFFISKGMKLLRVLDLEDASRVNDVDLKKMVQLLDRLKFLSLRGCRDIFNLPSSIGDLRQLQTLDVRDTSIITLPENIVECRKLQYIRAGRGTKENAFGELNMAASAPPVSSSWLPKFCKRRQLVGVVVPDGIGKLTALHTLGVVNLAASGSKAVLEELNELTQLRKLGVSGVNRKNSKDFVSAISGNVHLETLSVQLSRDNKNCLDDISLPFQNLRSLKLYGLGDKLPNWSSLPSQNGPDNQLRNLTKLNLEMDTLPENVIEFIGKLKQLSILRVKQLQDGELCFHVRRNRREVDLFQKVKVLEIVCGCSCSRLVVTFGAQAMQMLELFMVDCRNVASCQFSGMEHLSTLKEFLLK